MRRRLRCSAWRVGGQCVPPRRRPSCMPAASRSPSQSLNSFRRSRRRACRRRPSCPSSRRPRRRAVPVGVLVVVRWPLATAPALAALEVAGCVAGCVAACNCLPAAACQAAAGRAATTTAAAAAAMVEAERAEAAATLHRLLLFQSRLWRSVSSLRRAMLRPSVAPPRACWTVPPVRYHCPRRLQRILRSWPAVHSRTRMARRRSRLHRPPRLCVRRPNPPTVHQTGQAGPRMSQRACSGGLRFKKRLWTWSDRGSNALNDPGRTLKVKVGQQLRRPKMCDVDVQ